MKYSLFILLLIAVLLAELIRGAEYQGISAVYGCTEWQKFKCAGKCVFSKFWHCYQRGDDYDCECTPIS
ncbi:hypothetical protein TSAR_002372 [Trichomalopsis sarcophagae]|uniref:Invertebrate defensins family profile domain-containing protein n=1 Tax=Trichomalopsis sarcophagae TaxID=543379 RepID=A0A232EXT1_9HYME|nr:hypothetical protein TSAR_002372 [Trichomalopsis sarcophagae]